MYESHSSIPEKTLQELQKKRREIVEDIKKKTNYYSTRNLIERYDESSQIASPTRPGSSPIPPASARQPQPPSMPAQTPMRKPQIQTTISAAPRPGPVSAVNSQLASSGKSEIMCHYLRFLHVSSLSTIFPFYTLPQAVVRQTR
jgi:hypothetical protein